jgi:hypothetical protein
MSWYDALELQARQRVRGGNNLQLSYTLSRSLIDGVGREATTRSLQRASLQALAVVRGALAGLLAPAASEIVLDGWIHPGDVRPEGPFGEFHGYYPGKAGTAPADRGRLFSRALRPPRRSPCRRGRPPPNPRR